MPADAGPLLGRWRKTGREPCAATYPDRLEFRADGQYRGVQDVPGEYTVWDVGTFRVEGAGRVVLSTATDEHVAYQFRATADTLTFVDTSACTIVYHQDRG